VQDIETDLRLPVCANNNMIVSMQVETSALHTHFLNSRLRHRSFIFTADSSGKTMTIGICERSAIDRVAAPT
jgi:hypothetical protein